MTDFKCCPKCKREPKDAMFSNHFQIYKCLKCPTRYCDECGKNSCPNCGSTSYTTIGKAYA